MWFNKNTIFKFNYLDITFHGNARNLQQNYILEYKDSIAFEPMNEDYSGNYSFTELSIVLCCFVTQQCFLVIIKYNKCYIC